MHVFKLVYVVVAIHDYIAVSCFISDQKNGYGHQPVAMWTLVVVDALSIFDSKCFMFGQSKSVNWFD